jgi:hypothetical protein
MAARASPRDSSQTNLPHPRAKGTLAHSIQVGIINNLINYMQKHWELQPPRFCSKRLIPPGDKDFPFEGTVARLCNPIMPRGTPNTMPCPKHRTEHAASFYFFLPLPFALVAEPFDATLLARDVEADAGEALPLTASSCLFYHMLVPVTTYRETFFRHLP